MDPLATPPADASVRVVRPPSGLARGLWEAPAWTFYVVAAAALLGGILWGLLGLRSIRTGGSSKRLR